MSKLRSFGFFEVEALDARALAIEPSVYVLLNGDEVVYVGSSLQPRRRIHTHMLEGEKNFTHFAIRRLLEGEEIEEVEARIQHGLRPLFCGRLGKSSRVVSKAWVKKKFGVSSRRLTQLVKKFGLTEFRGCYDWTAVLQEYGGFEKLGDRA